MTEVLKILFDTKHIKISLLVILRKLKTNYYSYM